LHFFRKNDDDDDFLGDQESIPLQTDSQRQHRIRNEQILEAEVLENDTLASIAIRFDCSINDVKRLNKIHQDNEIYAFKVLKVPLTVHNILLDTLPKVHKSGSNSPRAATSSSTSTHAISSKDKLEEKLLVASVSSAVISKSESAVSHEVAEETVSINEPLLGKLQFRALRPPRNDFMTFNGSDCELNWICLLVAILLVCFIVPLIYVYLVYEHPEKFNHTHSRYDDTDLHFRAHIDDDRFNASSTENIHH
jgi:hypothetical protein